MQREVRTGRIDWGRSPSAIAYVEVLREDNSSSLLMIQPAHRQYRMREFPADFKYLDHRQCLLTVPQEVLRANTCPDKHETIAYDAERREKVEDTITGDDNLKWAALYYGKDPRTIRNWCRLGFFPSAYKTSGKHWRIPFGAIREAEKHLPDFARKPKTLLGSKGWAQLKPRLKNFPKAVRAAFEVYAAMQDLSNTEFRKGRPKVSAKAVEAMLIAYKMGNLPDLRLQLTARRLYAGDPTKRITRQMLARETGVSVAGLYRHYGAKKIEQVIREANQPFKSGDAGTKTLERLSEVAQMFAEYEGSDKKGQKVDFVSGLITKANKPTPKRKRITG